MGKANAAIEAQAKLNSMISPRNISLAGLGWGDRQRDAPASEALLYSGVALGVLAGAAISTYMWRSRVRAALDASPGERADKIIESCERKLERIEQLMREFGEKK